MCTEEIDQWDDEDDDSHPHLLDPTLEAWTDDARGVTDEIQPPPIVNVSETNTIQSEFEGM